MSSIGSPSPFFLAGKKAYEVERSLRFNRSDDAYLQATLGNSNLNKWTLSIWVKKAVNGEHQAILSSGDSSVSTMVNFGNNDRLKFTNYPGSSAGIYITTRKFRDPSAWYHIVAIWDSGNSTAGDRIRLYVNGVRETAFDQSDNPNQNQNSVINGNTQGGSTWGNGKHRIGRYSNYADNSGCYYAEVNFVDGQAYDPSYFAETNTATGQWVPKKYAGSYGSNGFYLKFADNSGTTATTLGKDSSGNGNNFTPNNFSVSAGAGNDSLEDTPTNNFCTLSPLLTDTRSDASFSNGNLTVTTGSGASTIGTTFSQTTGKWYAEFVCTAKSSVNMMISVNSVEGFDGERQGNESQNGGVGFSYVNNGNRGDGSSYGASWAINDVMGIALDLDNNTVNFYKNNSAQGTISITDGFNYMMTLGGGQAGTTQTFDVNFGQRAFTYTPPTGFKKLNSANLPDPSILLPNNHFDTVLYTGNGGTQSITGLEFQPDWVWIKERTGAYHHSLTDSVRGVLKTLSSSRVDIAEYSESSGLNQFLSNGLGFNGQGYFYVNRNSESYVAWNWNAGDTDGKTYTVKVVSDSGNKYRFDNFGTSAVTLDLAEGGTYIFNMDDSSNASHPFSIGTAANGTVYASGITYFLDGVSKTYSQYTSGFYSASTRRLHITVPASAPQLYYWCSVHSGMGGAINTNTTLGSSNFDGTTQSTVKVNQTAGFSIVTYTGTGSGANIGHGLGVAPQVVITKAKSATSSWAVLHTNGDPNAEFRLLLNDNGGYSSYQGGNLWNDTVPTSTHFRVSSDAATNASGVTYIAYVFSEVAGYSKFDKYRGNGNADGTFVFTGFRPAFVLIKRTDSGNNWFLQDDKRLGFNPSNSYLETDTALAEQAETDIDILSNGFKCRSTGNGHNNSSGTYIYFAFAEAPFKNARAR